MVPNPASFERPTPWRRAWASGCGMPGVKRSRRTRWWCYGCWTIANMDLLDQAHNGIVGSSFSHDTMPGPAAACIPGQKTKA